MPLEVPFDQMRLTNPFIFAVITAMPAAAQEGPITPPNNPSSTPTTTSASPTVITSVVIFTSITLDDSIPQYTCVPHTAENGQVGQCGYPPLAPETIQIAYTSEYTTTFEVSPSPSRLVATVIAAAISSPDRVTSVSTVSATVSPTRVDNAAVTVSMVPILHPVLGLVVGLLFFLV
ncbi:hypothetical protein FRC01_000250 [Tulasnella sp. 417]|nr:hypothetical protein FRC01_000250 [Tulasnella sp. 417]